VAFAASFSILLKEVIIMNKMEPIRDSDMIENLADYYMQSSSRIEWIRKRNHAFFIMGIFTGLRITKLLGMRVRDVRDPKGYIRDAMMIVEFKELSHATWRLMMN